MATYYVRNDGNNANTGLGPNPSQAWQTLAKALGASGISSGDTLYIAPGRYYESVTVGMTSATAETRIIGDPTASQFSDLTPGLVRWTQYINDIVGGSGTGFICCTLTSKNYLTFENIRFESPSQRALECNTCANIKINKCVFLGSQAANNLLFLSTTSNTPGNFTVTNNVFYREAAMVVHSNAILINLTGTADYDANVLFANNIILGGGNVNSDPRNSNVQIVGYTQGHSYFTNNTFGNAQSIGVAASTTSSAFPIKNYNGLVISTPNMTSLWSEKLVGLTPYDPYGPRLGSTIISAGQPTSTIVAITNGVTEIPSGGNTYVVGDRVQFTSTVGNVIAYNMYIVATVTGTTSFTCTGLTPTASGTTTHRRYRNDVDMFGTPYLTAGAATLGAVELRAQSNVGQYIPQDKQSMAVRLTPGSTANAITVFLGVTGLTASTPNLTARYTRNNAASVAVPLVAQTVGGAWVSGGFCEIDSVNLPGFYRFDLPNEVIANNTTALGIAIKGAVGTNGAYITAELEQPTTLISTTGYKLISDQMGANGILDIIKGSSITVKLQITDVNNKPIPLGSSTCTVEVYSLNNLVETYATTTQYQSNGEMTFVLDTTVTNTPGTYNVYVVRNNGGSDTVLYGPMKLVVSNL